METSVHLNEHKIKLANDSLNHSSNHKLNRLCEDEFCAP